MGLHAPERTEAKSRQVGLQAANIMGTDRKIVNQIARALVHRRRCRGKCFRMTRFEFERGGSQLLDTTRCTSCQRGARCHACL